MKNIDIGIIFDISSIMKSLLDLFDERDYHFKGKQILSILEKFAIRGISSKNEIVRFFSVIAGGTKQEVYDFCDLIEKVNKKFSESENEEDKYSINKLFKRLDSQDSILDINSFIQGGINFYTSKILKPKRQTIEVAKLLNGNNLLNIVLNIDKQIGSFKVSNWPKILDLRLNLSIMKKYIFGNSPLETAIKLALNTFKIKSKGNYNFLFIITGRDLNNSDDNSFLKTIKENALKNHINILTFFLTDKNNIEEKTLYDDDHYSHIDAKNLFELSTSIVNQDPFIKFLALDNWIIPKNGQTKLFIEVNNLLNLIPIIELFNKAVIGLDGLFDKAISEGPESFINIITNNKKQFYLWKVANIFL